MEPSLTTAALYHWPHSLVRATALLHQVAIAVPLSTWKLELSARVLSTNVCKFSTKPSPRPSPGRPSLPTMPANSAGLFVLNAVSIVKPPPEAMMPLLMFFARPLPRSVRRTK